MDQTGRLGSPAGLEPRMQALVVETPTGARGLPALCESLFRVSTGWNGPTTLSLLPSRSKGGQ